VTGYKQKRNEATKQYLEPQPKSYEISHSRGSRHRGLFCSTKGNRVEGSAFILLGAVEQKKKGNFDGKKRG